MDRVGLRRAEVAQDAVGLHLLAVERAGDARPFGQFEAGVELRAVRAFLDVESDVVVGEDGLADEHVAVRVEPVGAHGGDVAFRVERLVFDARGEGEKKQEGEGPAEGIRHKRVVFRR